MKITDSMQAKKMQLQTVKDHNKIHRSLSLRLIVSVLTQCKDSEIKIFKFSCVASEVWENCVVADNNEFRIDRATDKRLSWEHRQFDSPCYLQTDNERRSFAKTKIWITQGD